MWSPRAKFLVSVWACGMSAWGISLTYLLLIDRAMTFWFSTLAPGRPRTGPQPAGFAVGAPVARHISLSAHARVVAGTSAGRGRASGYFSDGYEASSSSPAVSSP